MPESTEVKGKFVWYDVMTTDVDAAKAFYGKVLGWTATDSGMPDRTYLLFSSGGATLAGLMPIPEDAEGAPPQWMGYIGVDDVDATAEKITAAGGAVIKEPWDVPYVGRIAVVGDPQGVGVCLFTPAPTYEQAPEVEPNTPGRIGWHDLHSSDGDKALEFYTSLFGWTKAGEVDMGPAGTYHMFATIEEMPVGGMMTKMAGTPGPPTWLYYWNVDAIDAAAERVKAAGGQVAMGPHEVPGGMWIVQAVDPQGAMFALVALKR